MDTSPPAIGGAATLIAGLEAAEHAANAARYAAYKNIRAPFDAACEAAFAAHGDSPEFAAAYAALVDAMNMDTHPSYAPLAAAHDAVREALALAAMSYMVETTLAAWLLRIHRGGRWQPRPEAGPTAGDVAAILWALPEGPIKALNGWRKVTVSPEKVHLCYHRKVVVEADNEGSRITYAAEEAQRLADEKARNRAEHDTYNAQLAKVRASLDADPAARAAVEVLYECSSLNSMDRLYGPAVRAAGFGEGHPAVPTEGPGRSAALALAYMGWGWRPGREGGVLLIPGGVPVGVRGALRIPRDVTCG